LIEVEPLQPERLNRSKIRIILANDIPLLRLALCSNLEKQQDMEIVAEASDGEEAVEIAYNLQPDVIIIDVGLRLINGIEATKRILKTCPNTKIILFDVLNEKVNDYVLKSGAHGYLAKYDTIVNIIRTVRSLAVGEINVPPQLHRNNNNTHPDTMLSTTNKINELSPREMTILKLVAKGMSNQDISLKLDLSVPIIKACLSTVFLKLAVSSRTEAIAAGLKAGILNINDLTECL